MAIYFTSSVRNGDTEEIQVPTTTYVDKEEKGWVLYIRNVGEFSSESIVELTAFFDSLRADTATFPE